MIISIIAGVCFAWWMVYVIQWHKITKYLNHKPFNCVPCLSAWASFVFCFIPEVVVMPVAAMFAAGILGIIIEAKMTKI